MKCIVTGGNGFIGSHVVSELLERGLDVVIYDIAFDDAPPVLPTVAFVKADIRDFERLCQTLKTADLIFHLSGVLGTCELFDAPREAIEINVTGALNVLLASLAMSRSPRIFFPGKHNEWNNIYSVTAQAVEKLAHAFRENMNLDVRTLRLPNVYGPRQKVSPVRKVIPSFVINALENHPLEIFGDGTQSVELLYVGDAAKSIVDFALQTGPLAETFELATNAHLSVNELARRIIAMTASSSSIVYLPMRLGESPGTSLARARDVQEVLGPLTLTSIENGMHETIMWYSRLRADILQKGNPPFF